MSTRTRSRSRPLSLTGVTYVWMKPTFEPEMYTASHDSWARASATPASRAMTRPVTLRPEAGPRRVDLIKQDLSERESGPSGAPRVADADGVRCVCRLALEGWRRDPEAPPRHVPGAARV